MIPAIHMIERRLQGRPMTAALPLAVISLLVLAAGVGVLLLR